MNKQNYTSPELSKKLAENGCELESKYYWHIKAVGKLKPVLLKGKKEYIEIDTATATIEQPKIEHIYIDYHYFAYDILNDICVKYATKFFGEYNPKATDDDTEIPNGKLQATIQILKLFQQNKKDEAENYIWEHCKFNPKNK